LLEHEYVWLLGVCVIMAFLSLLYCIWQRFSGRSFKLESGETGEVSISQVALRELICSACASTDLEGQPKVRVHSRRGKLFVRLSVKVVQGQDISVVTDAIKQRLAEAVHDSLGGHILVSVNVRASYIEAKSMKP